jgi:hypothetical protein
MKHLDNPFPEVGDLSGRALDIKLCFDPTPSLHIE